MCSLVTIMHVSMFCVTKHMVYILANHSTETAVLKVMSDIPLGIEDGNMSNLSAAFDTVSL